jgi:hypothetical protein
MGDGTPDLDALIEGSWKQYRMALTEARDGLGEDEPIRIEFNSGDDADGTTP